MEMYCTDCTIPIYNKRSYRQSHNLNYPNKIYEFPIEKACSIEYPLMKSVITIKYIHQSNEIASSPLDNVSDLPWRYPNRSLYQI